MDTIILASSSPRRQEILKRMNIPFAVNPAEIDETIPKEIKADKASEYLAAKKVDAIYRKFYSDSYSGWILGADTTITYKNKIYGKPKNIAEAREFLNTFQGKTHKVITGVALYNISTHYLSTRSSVNKVTFAPMTEQEIEMYLETMEWHDAAGGYKIQGLASCFISRIDGTESSVMGLPMFELYDMLKEQDYKFSV